MHLKLTWYTKTISFLNIFETMYNFPLNNEIYSNFIRNSFFNNEHLKCNYIFSIHKSIR